LKLLSRFLSFSIMLATTISVVALFISAISIHLCNTPPKSPPLENKQGETQPHVKYMKLVSWSNKLIYWIFASAEIYALLASTGLFQDSALANVVPSTPTKAGIYDLYPEKCLPTRMFVGVFVMVM